MFECFSLVIEKIKPCVCTDPKSFLFVGKDGVDLISADGGGVGGIVSKSGELFSLPVEEIQATAEGSYPDVAVLVFGQRFDKIIAQVVAGIDSVNLEVFTIIAVQAVEGSEPHKSLAVLDNTAYPVM